MPLAPGSIGYNLSGLAEFLQGIANLNDPDKAKRDAVERQLATNPESADYYKQHPEALDSALGSNNMFGKNKKQELMDRIKNSPDSAATLTEKAKQKAIKNVNDAEDPKNLRVTGMSLGTIPTLSKPDVSETDQDIFNRSVGLPTIAEKRLRETQQKSADVELDLKKSQLEDVTTRRNQAATTRKFLADNKLTPYDAYRNRAKLPSDVNLGLTSDPDLLQQVQLGQREYEFNQTYNLQKTALDSKHDTDRLLEMSRINSAQTIASKTGVDPGIIVNLMKSPADQAKYSNPTFVPKTPEEQQLKTVANELALMGGQINAKQRAQIDALYQSKINPLVRDIAAGKIKNEHVQEAVDQINALGVEIYGQHGLAAPVYKYGAEGDKRPIGLGHGSRMPFNAKPVLYRADTQESEKGKEDEVTLLTQKAAKFDELKAANPNLPNSVIQARVEAYFNKR